MIKVWLGLGSNLGDREKNMRDALGLLSLKVRIEKVSSLYETEPEGGVAQPPFLNAVLVGGTELSPEELLSFAKEIEGRLGRKLNTSGAPRTIDIDILFYDNLILKTDKLTIPHPKLVDRAFVLVPLSEISPDFIHPEIGKKIKELVGMVSGRGVRRFGRV